jgi:hypothetical protein
VAEVLGRGKRLREGRSHWEREDDTTLDKFGTDVFEEHIGVNKDGGPERHHRRMRLAIAMVVIAKSSQKYECKTSREGIPDIST